jgi:hypothetical protein
MPRTIKDRSRYIPKQIDKKVRKASGFRCAWCGKYLTVRHHIQPFSLGGPHSEDNLILLCPDCHSEAHLDKISQDELMKRRISLTGKVDRSSGCLSINKEFFQIDVGGNHFINCNNILMFNDIPLIQVRNDKGYLLISLKLFNDQGNLICWMSDNRWWVENEAILNFNFTKNTFSIIDKKSSQILQLNIKDYLIEIFGQLYLLGDVIQLSKNAIIFRNSQNMFIDNTFTNIPNAFVIKEKTFTKQHQGSIGVLMTI